jgi:site-specific recombinase XerD
MASSQTEFGPQVITTPTLTRYRAYLQKDLRQKPNSVNRALISLKRCCSWVMQKQLISYNPSIPVKLVGEEERVPRHLEDNEEQALVAAVTLNRFGRGQRDLMLTRATTKYNTNPYLFL